MKILKYTPILVVLLFSSCASITVNNDFDKKVDFTIFKTFAFYKTGIDKVEISDLDKRRILKAVETELLAKGFTKSENPDLLINFFTKSHEQVDVNTFNNGWVTVGVLVGILGCGAGIKPWFPEPLLEHYLST